ncbi:MAG: FG-GAP-like repeat-containing protein, partial [Pyrinomonadaceae bacterium]
MFGTRQSQYKNSQIRNIFFLIGFGLFFAGSIIAQVNSSLDLTFNTTVAINQNQSSLTAANMTVQPDGKILVFGNFDSIRDKAISKIARLNADGSIDNSFYCRCEGFQAIKSVVVQPDGKIMVAGDVFGTRLARLNADGSVDSSFNAQLNSVVQSATVWAVQPDGKILASTMQIQSINLIMFLLRFNSDGSVDNSFTALNFSSGQGEILYKAMLLPNGKIMVSGRHSFGVIFRINSNGTKDTSFESPTLVGAQSSSPYISDFAIQSDGKIVVSGPFVSVNGVSRNHLARLNTDGSVDLLYAPNFPGLTIYNNIEILSNDKILIQTDWGAANNVYPFFFRVNTDGTLDNTFSAAAPVTGSWRLDNQERILFAATVIDGAVTSLFIKRMNTDGSLDKSFSAPVLGITGEVSALAVQSDGKVILGGIYKRINGIIREGIARVNTDGTLDTGFVTGTGFQDTIINTIVIQPDGKILVGGSFINYNGTAQTSLTRLNTDGSRDTGFNPVLGTGSAIRVSTIALQPDGKILIGGLFDNVNGASRSSIARLNSDGSLDTTFNPLLGSAAVNSILVQADGKIVVGGAFSGVNGFNRVNLTRLNADGSLDASFNAGSISGITQVVRTSDAKYIVSTNLQQSILRRNADGTADGSFNAATVSRENGGVEIKRLLLQADGSIVLVGYFNKVNGTFRNNIARLSPNGRLDTLFFPQGSNDKINDIVAQTDGKLIVGGRFSVFDKIPRSSMARLTAAPYRVITNFDYDGDGKADISVFRPSENKWYVLRSSDSGVTQQVFAVAGDAPVPADYDGDGKTDFAIFRPSSNDWWSLYSSNGTQAYAHWGQSGVVPLPSDFDGDGRADYIFFLPSNSTWYRYGSNSPVSIVTFGLAGDKPVTGDFDGDGKTDVAIFRPSTGDWWWQSSVDNVQRATHWGISTDLPAPADYDGDGKTDFAVFRPSEGNWYVFNSSNFSYTILHWGIAEDKPVAADYDGDGKADIAVFRPSTGVWYLLRSTAGFTELPFGIAEDIPTPNS